MCSLTWVVWRVVGVVFGRFAWNRLVSTRSNGIDSIGAGRMLRHYRAAFEGNRSALKASLSKFYHKVYGSDFHH